MELLEKLAQDERLADLVEKKGFEKLFKDKRRALLWYFIHSGNWKLKEIVDYAEKKLGVTYSTARFFLKELQEKNLIQKSDSSYVSNGDEELAEIIEKIYFDDVVDMARYIFNKYESPIAVKIMKRVRQWREFLRS